MTAGQTNGSMAAPVDSKSRPPLAIVGMSLKFPGDAVSPESFWQMMLERRCVSSKFPADRLNVDAHYHPDAGRLDQLSTKGAHFVQEDLSLFDAAFFSISAAEAEAMDPQQRLVLETAYRALENAGISMSSIARSKTCVFAGAFGNDYLTLQVQDPQTLPKFHATGTSINMLSNRVSWFFDLKGPSATVDSACSSSLIAVDLACQSIWNGDSTMGMAIGSNIMLAVETAISLDNLGLLSPNAHCYSFDSRANGYARGEGIGVVVIKTLDEAIRNRDTIRAVIRGSASNQDGRTPGITQPSGRMQEQLIRDTYRKAGLDFASTRYFEAHGTGTNIGDPTEVRAIGNVARQFRNSNDPLYIGSVKSAIGHLEGSSGIAGLIKAILVVEKGIIPPNSTNFKSLNPKIDDEFFHIKIPTEAIAWPTSGLRRASVSSFGFGGSNTHVILDDAYSFLQSRGLYGNHNSLVYPKTAGCDGNGYINGHGEANGRHTNGLSLVRHESNGLPRPPTDTRLLVWSSADENGIPRLKDIWKPFLTGLKVEDMDRGKYLDNLAYTLMSRRSQLTWRTFAVARSTDDWTTLTDQLSPAAQSLSQPRIAFVFSGQGAQWYAMGRELIHTYPAFCSSLEEASNYLRTLGCEWDVIDELCKPESESNVNKTEYSQTLCTVLQVALVDLLRSFNVLPHGVVGHSSGEIAAAYCAGFISRKSAWKIAYCRGKQTAALERLSNTTGSMLAAALPKQETEKYFTNLTEIFGTLQLTIGCINSPKNVTVSGESTQIDALKKRLDEEGIFCRKLKVKVAYHSFQMHEIAEDYRSELGRIEQGYQRKPKVLMASSVIGKWTSGDAMADASYWVQNLISPVRFSEAVSTLCAGDMENPVKKLDGSHRHALKIHKLVEIGPHSTLQGPIREILDSMNKKGSVGYHSLLARGVSAVDTLYSALGHLYCAGVPVELPRLNFGDQGRKGLKSLPDLPEYPFDHRKSHWHEGRLSRNHRFAPVGKLDLLGRPDPIGNQLERQWRNFIRISEMPWVRDHKINGAILYPAAGMVVMALEAARQLADPRRNVSGFNVRDMSLQKAIQFPEGHDEIETTFYMRRSQGVEAKDSEWFEFRVCSYDSEVWSENCTGTVQIVYTPGAAEGLDQEDLKQEILSAQREQFSNAKSGCASWLDSESLYAQLERCGYGYGEAFQLIKQLGRNPQDPRTVVGEILKSSFSEKEIIHPTTLDCLVQTALWTMTDKETDRLSTAVPTYIERLWFPAQRAQEMVLDKMQVHTHSDGAEESRITVTALGDSLKQVVVEIQGLRCTAVDDGQRSADATQTDSKLCHYLEWQPDISLLSKDQILGQCNVGGLVEPEVFCRELDFLLNARVLETLKLVSDGGLKPTRSHLQNYVEWMAHQRKTLEGRDSVYKSQLGDADLITETEKKVMSANNQGYFFSMFARNLPKFLSGDMDPLAFLFEGTLARDFYNEALDHSHGLQKFKKYLHLLAHHNPRMKILEVGAGTGAMTRKLLDVLGQDEAGLRQSRYAHWDFTDISRSFFGNAEEELSSEKGRLKFGALNIEDDPAAQGYEAGTYDMVVAFWVLHATSNLLKTLSNARKLLKPGGKLVLYEITKPDNIRLPFVFGLLDGWWLSSESYRPRGPCVTTEKWHELLVQTGFSGCDIEFPDFESDGCRVSSLIVSTAMDPGPSSGIPPSIVEIVYDPALTPQHAVAHTVRKACSYLGCLVRCVSLEEAVGLLSPEPANNLLRIFLLEMHTSVLYDVDAHSFPLLQQLIISPTKTLWVNQGGNLRGGHPQSRLVDGLLRVMMEEDFRRNRHILSLEPGHSSEDIGNLMTVVKHLLTTAETIDTEYIEHDGLLHIPRAFEGQQLNRFVGRRTTPRREEIQPFGCGMPLRLDIPSSKLLTGFKFIENEALYQPLADDEIEIQVQSVGVNFRDVLVALGQLKAKTSGLECSGIVTKIGNACKRFQPGDRVCALYLESYATAIRMRESGPVEKIPDAISFADAASLPTVFITSYIALHSVARLQPGESILIHSAAGGTGQAAIQLAQQLGATIFVTVGSESKKALLMEVYGLSATNIFSSRSTLFLEGIKHRTGGKGVDVVLNSLAGDSLLASWECLAPYGRFIEIGKRDILKNHKLPMGQFVQNITFSAVDLAAMAHDRPDVCQAALRSTLAWMAEGKIRPPHPVTVYGIGEIEKVFRLMQSGKHVGKMVLEMRPEDPVTTVVQTKTTLHLEADATYVICGGFGGLGRNVSRWLVDRGARNLLFLSRSGGRSSNAKLLIGELEAKGVNIISQSCDIANEDSLRQALSQAHSLPPIKGCIQAAMVLHNAAFEVLNHQLWSESVAPKAQGSWNLHNLLPKGMDFFIMFSSVVGVAGMKGQANYAAGNTFQDGLARYRAGLGENATALDLGLFTFAGALADDAKLSERTLSRSVLKPVEEPELHALLEYYCNPGSTTAPDYHHQVTVGLRPAVAQKGLGTSEWLQKRMFCLLPLENGDSGEQKKDTATMDVTVSVREAGSLADASAAVTAGLVSKLAKTLSLTAPDIDVHKPMHQYGVDSLVAVELRGWFSRELQADIAVFDIMGSATIEAVAHLATSRTKLKNW